MARIYVHQGQIRWVQASPPRDRHCHGVLKPLAPRATAEGECDPIREDRTGARLRDEDLDTRSLGEEEN